MLIFGSRDFRGWKSATSHHQDHMRDTYSRAFDAYIETGKLDAP
jgi:hypothetical protein